MTRVSLPRRRTWLAALALAAAVATTWDGRAPAASFRAPETNERRHVRNGPDSPDEALRYIQIAMRDEFGNIDPNGLMNARRQVDGMRAMQAARALQAALVGQPDPAAGISRGAWTWIGPGNIGGRTRAIAIHPTSTSTIFAGSVAGGIWKSVDAGANWNVVDDFMTNLAVTAIVFQPGNPSVMYAATGEGFFNVDAIRGAGIFKSVDGGTTWSQLASTANSNFSFVTDLAMSADGTTLLASTPVAIFKSVNGGTTFTTSNLTNVNFQDVKFLPGSSTLAVAGGRVKDAYYSVNGGGTWTLALGMTSSGELKRVELGVSPASPTTVYASVNEGQASSTPPAELWKSTDGGQNYSLVSAPTTSLLGAQGWYANAIWVDPTNGNTLVVGGLDLWRSTDGGASFTQISDWRLAPTSAHADHHVIVHDPGFNGTTNKRVYFGNDGGLYRANDVYAAVAGPGIPFQVLNNNYGVTQFYGGAAVQNGKVFGGTQDNGTLLYTPANGAQAWTSLGGGDGGFTTGDQTDPNFMYGESQWLNVFRNSTNGVSPSVDISGCFSTMAAQYVIADCKNLTTNFIAPILLDPNNPNRLLGGGQSLWRTDDARTATTGTTGPSWAIIKGVTTGSSAIATLAIQRGSSDRIWVGHNNSDIYVTSDGTGASPTWTKVDLTPATGGPPDRAVTQISLDPVNPNIAYVSFGGFNAGNVWKTPDGGTSWVNISGSGGTALPSVPVRSIVPHPSVASWLYAGTDIGIFTSIDGGATWSVPNDGPANVAVFQLFWTGNTLVAVTHGRGLFTANVAPPSTPPALLTQPASQTISRGSSVALSVSVTGSLPIFFQWYRGIPGDYSNAVAGATSPSFTPPAVFVTTTYFVRVANAFGAIDSNGATLTPQTGLATYDPVLRAPKCTIVSSACDTGATAVLGRDTISLGPEPNQPNTINNSCNDGTSGTFHVDESIDRLTVSTLDGTPLAPGKTVRIDARVWAFTLPADDRLDLYYAANATSPTWTFLATLTPPVAGAQTLSATYILPAGGLQAVRASFRLDNGAPQSACMLNSGFDDHDDLIFAVGAAAGVEMMANGNFTSSTTGWLQWEVPFIVSSVVNGVFQFFLNNPGQAANSGDAASFQPPTAKQAAIYQNTGMAIAAGEPLLATFQLGNSSTVRKRMSVLVLESDFSDLSVCTFWLPPGQTTLKNYTMRTHTTKAWTNASIYFYAATEGSNGGNYLVDNASLKYTPTQPNERTECVDPNAPATSAGTATANLLLNGDFALGALLPGWSAVAPITTNFTGGVLEFLRPSSVTPAGNLMQATGQVAVVNQLLTATFSLGNSSNVRKRVTVLLHDLNLTINPDLTACTFWLPPAMPLSNYLMRGYATQQWTNATISFYPATVGNEQWIRLDNVTFGKTAPTAGVIGTECFEPISITFPVAFPGGGSTATGSRAGGVAPAAAGRAKAPGALGSGGFRMAADQTGVGTIVNWRAEAWTSGVATINWAEPIDLTIATAAQLSFASLLSPGASSGDVQVSLGGGTWQTIATAPATGAWTTVDVDLSEFAGQTILVRFVYTAVAPGQGVAPDVWRIGNVSIAIRGGKGG